MPDEIMQELWAIKDCIAREHGNDVRKLATYLQRKKGPEQPSQQIGRSAVDIPEKSDGQLLNTMSEDVKP